MTTFPPTSCHPATQTSNIDLVFHDSAITQFLFPASEITKARNWSYLEQKLRITTQTNHYRRLLFFVITVCALCIAAGKLTLIFLPETRVIIALIATLIAGIILIYTFDLTGLRTNFEFNRDASKFAEMLDEFCSSRQYNEFLKRFPDWDIPENHSAQGHEDEPKGKKLLRQIVTLEFHEAIESKEAFSAALRAFLGMWPKPSRTTEHMQIVMDKFGL